MGFFKIKKPFLKEYLNYFTHKKPQKKKGNLQFCPFAPK